MIATVCNLAPGTNLLNIRSRPSMSGSVVRGTVRDGQEVSVLDDHVLDETGDGTVWCEIQYKDVHGWVMKKYLCF